MGRSRRNWKPSQWAKSRPVTDGFIHCKICSGELREDGLGWEWPQEGEAVPPPPPVERPPRPMPPYVYGQHIPDSAKELVEAAVRFDTKAFGDFVSECMNRVPF